MSSPNATAVRERQCLMKAPMVRATLAGWKTQTRRVVELPHDNPLGRWEPTTVGGPNGGRTRDGVEVPESPAIWHTRTGTVLMCPHGVPGDRLWVREAWGYDARGAVIYRADEARVRQLAHEQQWVSWPRWRPSIHMHRHSCRCMLEVTEVRVQRLQEITEADALAEGIRGCTKDGRLMKYGLADVDGFPGGAGWPWSDWELTARDAFRVLWDSINAKREGGRYAWAANPWVWALSFGRVEAAHA